MNTKPLDQLWVLQKISPEIEELNQIPLFGSAPSFDWTKFSSLVSTHLDVESLHFRPTRQEWRPSEKILEGFGPGALVMPIDLPSLSGRVYWIMTRKEIQKFTAWMLGDSVAQKSIASDILEEGFYRYLLLEILDAASQTEPLNILTPTLQEEAPLPEEKAFCVDIEWHFGETVSSGRLAIPNSVRVQWCKHFKTLHPDAISLKMARNLELSLSVRTGSIFLYPSEWEKVQKGDFILLDKGSYDPRHSTGLATLGLNEIPLFQVDLEPNKIHLLNYAFIYEDATDMQNDTPEDDEFEEEEEDVSLDTAEEAEAVSLKETPIHITVELAKLRVTLEKLMQLTPGNVLDLPLEPDQSVALIVGGKKIGKAELVYLGEKLGVRILELG